LTKGVDASALPATRLLPATQEFAQQVVSSFQRQTILKQREEPMKLRLLGALVGLAISFALPTFAQTRSPQLREALTAYDKKEDEAFNNNDAAALAALYTEDAVEVTDSGTLYGREAIEKHYADLFQKVHFSNHLVKADQYSPHIIGTWGNDIWASGDWSTTNQGQNGTFQVKGYWSALFVREGDTLKTRMLTWNVTPAPAATPSPTTAPSSQ
jgi:ketosteroid isomerase-like protein